MPFVRRIGRPGLIGTAARTAVIAGTATAVAGGVASSQQRKAEERYEADAYQQQQQQAQMQAAAQQAVAQQQAAPAPAPAAGGDTTSELERLAGLHQQGILTDEEFSAAKQKLLGL
ncbi:SHOCT domain-containing protein [Humibacter ginsenosidimutans]|uniref:SHOCT domain-containing protein n=1 Tax=Humibacter ginsenosidimutans TaxID=2599293 RepID=A0A5B8M8Y8_9MICO|nr:SHOCT domain-containing protein [Humibacter ginsenosidimutans]QDZ16055.1 SHOCT domain-containing protein [Humibacter ginsenosidimutans]